MLPDPPAVIVVVTPNPSCPSAIRANPSPRAWFESANPVVGAPVAARRGGGRRYEPVPAPAPANGMGTAEALVLVPASRSELMVLALMLPPREGFKGSGKVATRVGEVPTAAELVLFGEAVPTRVISGLLLVSLLLLARLLLPVSTRTSSEAAVSLLLDEDKVLVLGFEDECERVSENGKEMEALWRLWSLCLLFWEVRWERNRGMSMKAWLSLLGDGPRSLLEIIFPWLSGLEYRSGSFSSLTKPGDTIKVRRLGAVAISSFTSSTPR